jgi:hypothetical protein
LRDGSRPLPPGAFLGGAVGLDGPFAPLGVIVRDHHLRPSRPNSSAVPRPIPEPPAVISATLPSTRPAMMGLLAVSWNRIELMTASSRSYKRIGRANRQPRSCCPQRDGSATKSPDRCKRPRREGRALEALGISLRILVHIVGICVIESRARLQPTPGGLKAAVFGLARQLASNAS